jgi:rhodanese-related sulfurtransferase
MKNSFREDFVAGLMLAISLASAPRLAMATSAGVHEINCADVSVMLKSTAAPTLIDVRYPDAYQRSHIPGAVSLPFYDLKKIQYKKDAPIVVYCSGIGCSLSHDAALELQDMGYTNVKSLYGGIAEWEKKGLPLERDPNAPTTVKPPYFFPRWAAFHQTDVSPKDLSAKLKSGGQFTFIDIRPEREYAAGHIAGALNVPLEQLQDKLKGLSKKSEYVVYDRRVERSRKAALTLQDGGYAAHSLSGGLVMWTSLGLPLTTGPNNAK